MEEEEIMWKLDSNSVESATIGRVMSTLLSSRPRKLQEAIFRFGSNPHQTSVSSSDESLWFLNKYVTDAVEKKDSLDQILVPMIESSLKYRGRKHSNQPMIILNWLFQEKLLCKALVTSLATMISRKEDRYIALGWCTLVRELLEVEITMTQPTKNGISENYYALLEILCACIPRLTVIMCDGSGLQDGSELPTRLSVAAADCFLALTEALTRKTLLSKVPSRNNASNSVVALSRIAENKVEPVTTSSEASNNVELDWLLWDHLDELIVLVQKLVAWNRKSRPLYAKGLEQVLKWLEEIKSHYGNFPDEADKKILKTGVLLLSSCWKHYSRLLHLEDHKISQHYKDLLEQYLSGIQFYTENCTEKRTENGDTTGIETRKFFLNCLSLLLGRFDQQQFDRIMLEYGIEISNALLSQFHSADEDVIEGSFSIFKAAVFKANYSSSQSRSTGTSMMDSVVPSLLDLLNERNVTSKAVVMLVAEYCFINTDGHCLQEILKLLDSPNALQRTNAVDVVRELIRISSDSVHVLSNSMWQDVAKRLLERLADEEPEIRSNTSNLLPMIDPSLIFPSLVHLFYSSDERVCLSASDALIAVLKYHSEKHEVIFMLLDSLSNLTQSLDIPDSSRDKGQGGSMLDFDKVRMLIAEWSKSVKDWKLLIEPLIDKMLAEPSNANIVKFLSHISEHLADNADIVFSRVLLHMKGQELDKSFFARPDSRTCTSNDSDAFTRSLFDRLCPLLIIRLLPLRVFNHLQSRVLYCQCNEVLLHASKNGDIDMNRHDCVATLLMNRAFGKFEFEDVRKLAAELCGRFHPKVLFPIISSQLEHAAESQDILKIKACLFCICTSLVVRGWDPKFCNVLLKVRNSIEKVLLWRSLEGDEVSKAQHGCIDCLALMICAEVQTPESIRNSSTSENIVAGKMCSRSPTLNYVISQLMHGKHEFMSPPKLNSKTYISESSFPLPFRICMANTLISACQKISDIGREPFAQMTLPHLVHSIEVVRDQEIRAACIQVVFSVVYHVKSAVLPFAPDILEVALKSLREGSEKEKMAGAKLMASLMASEDPILECISEGLLEARSLLSVMSSTDPSPDLRQLCKKLLVCLTSP